MYTPLENMKHKVFEATPIHGRHLLPANLHNTLKKNEPPMSWSLHFNNSGPSNNMVVLLETMPETSKLLGKTPMYSAL